MVEKFFRQLYVAVLGLIPIAVGVWGKAFQVCSFISSMGGLIPTAVGVWGEASVNASAASCLMGGLIPTAVGVWGEAAPARVLLYSRGLIPTAVGVWGEASCLMSLAAGVLG